jgi:hypothetical protein
MGECSKTNDGKSGNPKTISQAISKAKTTSIKDTSIKVTFSSTNN